MTHNELARISILFKVYYRNQKRIFSQPINCDCFWFLILRFRYTVSTLLYSHDLLKYTTTLFIQDFYLQVPQVYGGTSCPLIPGWQCDSFKFATDLENRSLKNQVPNQDIFS